LIDCQCEVVLTDDGQSVMGIDRNGFYWSNDPINSVKAYWRKIRPKD